jgi:hypothetical protein
MNSPTPSWEQVGAIFKGCGYLEIELTTPACPGLSGTKLKEVLLFGTVLDKLITTCRCRTELK